MRIGIDYTSAVQQRAGIGRYTRELVRALSRMDRKNDYLLFSAGRDRLEEAWPDNFRRRSLPLTDGQLAAIWHRLHLPLPAELVTGPIDLLHSPDFSLPPVRRAKTVLTVHDLSFMRFPECSPPPLLDYLMGAVPASVERANMVVADSESTRRDLIELLGVEDDRVTVVHGGLESRFRPETDVAGTRVIMQRYGIRRPYLLALGTLQPRKNFARLIRAYHALRNEHRIPHQLVIGGGKGWLAGGIYDTIAELDLREQVLLAGFVDDADLPAIYTAADVFAFPSLYEGFGIPVLEAMACGTPVVASSSSSIPEVAGDAALLVSPEDVEGLSHALWRLIDDGELRDRLVNRGFSQARRFTWESSAYRLLSVYEQVTAKGG